MNVFDKACSSLGIQTQCPHPNGKVFSHLGFNDKPVYLNCDCGYAMTKDLIDNKSQILAKLKEYEKSEQYFAFTLNTNVDDPEEKNRLIDAVHKLFTQQSCPIQAGGAYLEYCADGKPHIHGWYKREGGHRIYAKIFKRCWPLWDESIRLGRGHQGGYHKEAGTNYFGYAAAEGREVIRKNLDGTLVYSAE